MRADLEGDLVQPVYTLLHTLAPIRLADLLHGLETTTQRWIAEQTARIGAGGIRTEIAAEMRYDGQDYDVTVPLDRAWLADNDRARISAAFHEAHRATYGHANETAHIWLKELRAHVVGEMPKPRLAPLPEPTADPAPTSRPVRLLGRLFTASVIDRSALRGTITSPAIINQMDTTTLVPPDWRARRIASGALVLGSLPDAPCSACGCLMWLRRSVQSGGPVRGDAPHCHALPGVPVDATAIPAPAVRRGVT